MKAFIEAAIDRKRTTLAILLMLLIAGIASRLSIPIESEPNIQIPVFVVTVVHEGISPEDAERLIVLPLEAELRSVEGVDQMRSFAAEGSATVSIEFDVDYPATEAMSDVREAVDRAKPKIPGTAEEPIISEVNTSDFPILVVNFSGDDVPERVLFQLASKMQDDIEAIPDVLEANLTGAREELLEAVIDPTLLESHGISMADLALAVSRNNRLIAAGNLDTGRGRFAVKVPSVIEDARDLFNIPVKTDGNTVVTVADVATIRRTFKDRNSYARVNGTPAMSIEVVKRVEANLVDTVARVRELVERERASIPKTVRVFYTQDQAPHSLQQVEELEGNILTSLVLVTVTVIAILGVRSGLIVGAAIPVSFLFGLILVSLQGFSFNFMVMFGMLLGLGMIVDGAIVVTEYADRKMAEGVNRRDAYAQAAMRMFWPVASSTATTLAAFLPLLFWPGVSGKFMSFLPATVFTVLIGSLLYAIFFGPAFGALIGKRPRTTAQDTKDYENLEEGDPRQVSGLTGLYARVLHRVVSWPLLSTACVFTLIVGVFAAYGTFGKGMTFFTDTDPQFAQILVRARGNLSANEKRDLVVEVENILIDVPGIKELDSRTMASSGGGFRGGSVSSDLIGRVFVQFHEQDERALKAVEILEQIRGRTSHLAGMEVNIQKMDMGPPTGKDLQIELSSRRWDLVAPAVTRIRAHMENEMAGLRDIEDTRALPGIEWELAVDRAQAALFGVDVTTVGQAVQLVTNGIKVAEYRPDDAEEEVDIRIRYPIDERGIQALSTLRVPTPRGELVPVSNFVNLAPTPNVDTIERVDGRRVLYLRANVQPGVLADAKVKELQAWMDTQQFDPILDVRFRGANEEQAESMQFIGLAFSLALLLMGVLLVTQFNSYYQTLLILLAVVMSTAGILLGLMVTQEPFSAILTGVGVVALAGIVVNNNIILIDTYNELRREFPNASAVDVIVRTGAQRLRPVFLTTFTTVFGLIPMASHTSIDLIARTVVYGGQVSAFWVPLARSVVFGLSFATLLTLIATPAMLAIPSHLTHLFQRARAQLKRETSAQPATTT